MAKLRFSQINELVTVMRAAQIPDDKIIDTILAAEEQRKAKRRLDVVPSEWHRVRGEVLRRDDFTCVYCGSKGDGVALHCDHVLPKSRGGKSTSDNLVTACKSCNSRKRARTPEEWRGMQ